MANPIKIIKNGIINENPTFVQVIGMCPTLAVTSSAISGMYRPRDAFSAGR